jgi:hypothetical protein
MTLSSPSRHWLDAGIKLRNNIVNGSILMIFRVLLNYWEPLVPRTTSVPNPLVPFQYMVVWTNSQIIFHLFIDFIGIRYYDHSGKKWLPCGQVVVQKWLSETYLWTFGQPLFAPCWSRIGPVPYVTIVYTTLYIIMELIMSQGCDDIKHCLRCNQILYVNWNQYIQYLSGSSRYQNKTASYAESVNVFKLGRQITKHWCYVIS